MVCFSVALCHSNLHYQCLKINKINLSFHFKLTKEQNLLGVLFQEQAINIYILCLPFTYGHILWWCVTKFLNCMTLSCCKFGYKLETGLKTPKSKLKIARSLYPLLQIYNSFMFSYAASSFIGNSLPRFSPMKKRVIKISGEVRAAAAVTTSPVEETKEYEFLFLVIFHFSTKLLSWKLLV